MIITSWLRYRAAARQKQKMTCAASEGSVQPGHLPSLISLCCRLEEGLGSELPIKCTAKTLIRQSVSHGYNDTAHARMSALIGVENH